MITHKILISLRSRSVILFLICCILNRIWGKLGWDRVVRYSDSLRAGWSADRIPVGARFPAPIQTGLGAHPTSCTMGTGSFPAVKRLGRGVDHPPPSRGEVKERVELYLYSHSGPSWPVLG